LKDKNRLPGTGLFVLLFLLIVGTGALPVLAQSVTGTGGTERGSTSNLTDQTWYDYLTGSARNEALQIQNALQSSRKELTDTQDAVFERIQSEKQSLEDSVLKHLLTSPEPSTLPSAIIAERSRILGLAAEYVSGGSAVQRGGQTIAQLKSRIRKLVAQRRTLVLHAPPEPGTSNYRNTASAFVVSLSAEGADTGALTEIGSGIDALARSASDTAAMEKYIRASGGDMGRFPRNDDVAGWRFLLSQALYRNWLTIVASVDLKEMASELTSEASRIAPLSSQLSELMARTARETEKGETETATLEQNLGRFWTDLNSGFLLAVSASGMSTEAGSPRPKSGTQNSSSSSAALISEVAREFGSLLHDVKSVPEYRLETLLTSNPLASALAANFGSILATISVKDRLRLGRIAGSDLESVNSIRALLAQAEQAADTKRAARLKAGTENAALSQGLAFTERRNSEASKILQEAVAALQYSEGSQNRHWAFLGLLENRYAWRTMMKDPAYGALRPVMLNFVERLRTEVNTRTVALIRDAMKSGSPTAEAGGKIVLENMTAPSLTLREVAAYSEYSTADGTLVRAEIPGSIVWNAFATAFYEATQGHGTITGDPSVALDWALLHGQAVVHWYWMRAQDVNPTALMDEKSLQVYLHGERRVYKHDLQSKIAFISDCLSPWIRNSVDGRALGSDAISSFQPGVVSGSANVEQDRRWSRFAIGFLMLREQMDSELLSPIAGYGVSPYELLTDRERYTLSLLSDLGSLSESPPEALSRLSMLWLGTPMTTADPLQAERLGSEIIRRFSLTAESTLQRLSFEARAVASLNTRQFLVPSNGADAATFAIRALRHVNSEARRSRVTGEEFQKWRSRVFDATVTLAREEQLQTVDIANLLERLNLVNRQEAQKLGARK
jgi:hypothetical protein